MGVSSVCVEEGERRSEEELGARRRSVGRSVGRSSVGRSVGGGKGGGPETRSGTVQSLKCCPCQQKRAARLPSAAPGSIKARAPKRARAPSRARSAAPASRNEPRGSQVLRLETRSGTVQSLKCCPCQQKRAARLPSAAPGSIKGGGPETRSGTVQSLKCCPCQQKRAARLPSAAPGSIKGGGPETRSGTVQSLKCCPCQQKRAARLPSVCLV